MDLVQPNGELYLLYRHLRNRKIYHGFNAKNGSSRKKGVMIPQEFSGKFCLFVFLFLLLHPTCAECQLPTCYEISLNSYILIMDHSNRINR